MGDRRDRENGVGMDELEGGRETNEALWVRWKEEGEGCCIFSDGTDRDCRRRQRDGGNR